MNIRKFTARTSREALRMLREALGADAVILSNRNVDGGVEIMAVADDVIGAMTSPNQGFAAAPSVVPDVPRFQPRAAIGEPARVVIPPTPAPAPVVAEPVVQRPARASQENEMSLVMQEIRSMRGMLESQLAELAWGNTQKRNPEKMAVLKEMLATGLSASLSRYLLEKMPESGEERGLAWIKSTLARNLLTIGNENEMLERGGVYALVGPTGVGKTTTTAKLAARCVMRHGSAKLALITTDGYRIGGYEQLRIYGKILGVMVHTVKDETDLRIALSELKNKHTVLIDTVGVSQRDKMVTEQVAMLSGADANVKRLLCLSATSNAETLNEVVRSYQGAGGLSGCILTKLDEAATIGGILDVVIRQKLDVHYIANGQRVPEDLHVANRQYLIERAFKLKRETAPFRFADDELPAVMSNAAMQSLQQNAMEVSFG